MRKVYVSTEVEILVPVKVQASLIVSAEEGVDIESAVRKWAVAQKDPNAEIEVIGHDIQAVGGLDAVDDYNEIQDNLDEAVQNALLGGTGIDQEGRLNKIHNLTIIDSK